MSEVEPEIEAKTEEPKEDFDEFRIADGFVIDQSGLENIRQKPPKKKDKKFNLIIS